MDISGSRPDFSWFEKLIRISLIYVVYHYSRAKRASAKGEKYSVISGIQRISRISICPSELSIECVKVIHVINDHVGYIAFNKFLQSNH